MVYRFCSLLKTIRWLKFLRSTIFSCFISHYIRSLFLNCVWAQNLRNEVSLGFGHIHWFLVVSYIVFLVFIFALFITYIVKNNSRISKYCEDDLFGAVTLIKSQNLRQSFYFTHIYILKHLSSVDWQAHQRKQL